MHQGLTQPLLLMTNDYLARYNLRRLVCIGIAIIVLSGRWRCCLSATGNGSGSACRTVIDSYLEATYKCLPDEFSETSVCDGGRLRLSCPKAKYLAIHFAEIAPSTEAECSPSRSTDPDEQVEVGDCPVICARQWLVDSCQGRRKCTVETESFQFASSAFSDACLFAELRRKPILRIVYTCVTKYILKAISGEAGHRRPALPDLCPAELTTTTASASDHLAAATSSAAFPVTRKTALGKKSSPLSTAVAMATSPAAATAGEDEAGLADALWSESGRGTTSGDQTTAAAAAAEGDTRLFTFDSSLSQRTTAQETEDAEILEDTDQVLAIDSLTTVAMETADAVTNATAAAHLEWSDLVWYYLSSEGTWLYRYVTENKEKFVLYVALAISVGFIFVLFIIVLRLSHRKPLAPCSSSSSSSNHHHHHHHHCGHCGPSSKSDPPPSRSSPSSRQPLTCTSPITWRLPDIDPSIAGDERPGRGCEVQLTSFNRLNSLPRPRRDSTTIDIPPPPSPASDNGGQSVIDAGDGHTAVVVVAPAAAAVVLPEAVTSTTATISRSHLNFLDSQSFTQPRHVTTIPNAPVGVDLLEGGGLGREVGVGGIGTGTVVLPQHNQLFHLRHQYSLSAISVRPMARFGSFERASGSPTCGQQFRELSELAQMSKTLELPTGNRYYCS